MRARIWLAALLIACTGEQGEQGAVGASGEQGVKGERGEKGDPGQASGPATDAGPTIGRPAVVWKDAQGTTIPVIATSPIYSAAETRTVAMTYLLFVDAQGIVWALTTVGGFALPVHFVSGFGVLFYMSADCAGPAYVDAFPARVTFRLPGETDVRYVKDDAAVLVDTKFYSYRATVGGNCVNSAGGSADGLTLLTNTAVAAAGPQHPFKPPFRPEYVQ